MHVHASCGGGSEACTTQVLAKSCKMIPVMLVGTLVSGKQYTSVEYFCALALAGGISLFAQKGSAKVTTKLHTPNAPLGYFLCLTNLVFDGYTNAAQVRTAAADLAAKSCQMLSSVLQPPPGQGQLTHPVSS